MNTYTHYYLYAKGHYEASSIVDDLIKIHADIYNTPAEYCGVGDVKRDLLRLAYFYIKTHHDPESKLAEFVDLLHPDNAWKINAADMGFDLRLIKNCLSILRLVKVEGLELGQTNPKVLPLSTPSNPNCTVTPAADEPPQPGAGE